MVGWFYSITWELSLFIFKNLISIALVESVVLKARKNINSWNGKMDGWQIMNSRWNCSWLEAWQVLSHLQQPPELSASIFLLCWQDPSYSTLAVLQLLSILRDTLFTREREIKKSQQINKRLGIELLPLWKGSDKICRTLKKWLYLCYLIPRCF